MVGVVLGEIQDMDANNLAPQDFGEFNQIGMAYCPVCNFLGGKVRLFPKDS
jgi:hypothetical protein